METKEWYFMDSGIHSPAYNMALDEYLLDRGRTGDRVPILRFYQWDPPGLSIGYFQKTAGRIDKNGLQNHGFELVRRLTGGLAVLHHEELTYSVVIPEGDPSMPHSILGAYRVLSRGLLEGFHALGLQAELATPEPKKNAGHSPVCFEEASWYELVVEGKKAAGSAQTRQKGMILQHGSIPLHVDQNELFDCFVYANERVKERAKHAFSGKAIALDQIAGRTLTMAEVKQAFSNGFMKGLGISLKPLVLTEADKQSVEELADKKYAAEAWNYAR
ncbi:MAG: biotin/lipoate A/B protein ligase family protein [Sporolactobacillus sp.]